MTGQSQSPWHDGAAAERRNIERLQEDLAAQFPHLPTAVIVEHVDRALLQFDEVPIREYVPVLVTRAARAALADARAGVAASSAVPAVA